MKVAPPLAEAWSLFGKLYSGGEEWLQHGWPSPLACQDGLAAPGWIQLVDGRLDFLFENQGNWSVGYKHDDPSPDPEVYSNWVDLLETRSGHVPVGARLSRFIITSALNETIFWCRAIKRSCDGDERLCDEVLWVGHYYNAVGFNGRYEAPSQRIRTNGERTLLALDWQDAYSGFIADRDASRRGWATLKRAVLADDAP